MNEKNDTLKEYLDKIAVRQGNNTDVFVLKFTDCNTVMSTTRRYLESPAFKKVLDYEIVDYKYPYKDSVSSTLTILLVLKGTV